MSNDNSILSTQKDTRKFTRLASYSIALVISLIVIGVFLFEAFTRYKIIPLYAQVLTEEIIALVLGIIIIVIIGREIRSASSRLLGTKRADMTYVVFRFVGYVALALILLAIAGVSPTALLAGGTFAGLVLGLAAQTVLSNIIAGIMLILARPYEVGDRITFVTWQYGLIAPTYPPKFFSQDTLIPGYSGEVSDISLAYTVMKVDDGPSIKVPNSVMVQAAVVSHELKERWIRTKYEIPMTITPDVAISALKESLKKNQWIVNQDSIIILVNSTTASSYVLSIDILCKGNMEDQPRSSILTDIMQVVNKLKEEQTSESAAATN